MKKIGLFLFAAVMSLLAVSCRDVLLEKNIGGFSVSFQTPGSSSRAGTTATWELEAWLELEGGAQLQKKNETVPANAPITISFDAVPIGTKLKVQVRLEDSENQFIQHEGSSDWITVDAESKTVAVQVQRKTINAAAPTITTQPASQDRRPESGSDATWTATLTVVATSPDGGNLSYKWYENTANSNSGGTLIPEATKEYCDVPLNPGETKYFYCKVTNTNNTVNGTKDATTTSNVAKLVYDIAQSGVLLWRRNVDSGSHNILTAPYGAYDSPADTGITFGASDSSQGTPFCFDSNGNLYVMSSDAQSALEVKKYDLQPDGTYVDSNTNISTNGQVFNYLAYDSVAGTLYGIGGNASLHYCKSGETSFTTVQGDTVNGGSYLGLAVYDNIVYTAETGLNEGDNGEIVVSLSRYDLSAGSSQKLGEAIHHQLPGVFGTDTSALTGQMIYQEGALYLSIGSLGFESSVAGYSVGAVIKIDAETLAVEANFGENGYLGLLTSVEMINNKQCYAPTEANENDYFYGPMGFVAIMPKKLVIADAGFSMSAASTGSNVSLSKKSRIVTVDLETEALSSVAVEDYYEPTYSTGCGFLVVN